MSLISKQIDELRAYAKDRKGELAKLINDAADTIEMLSAKLQNPAEICAQIETDNLRRWCKKMQELMKMALPEPYRKEGD